MANAVRWNRAFRALEVLASDLRGRLAMAGPKDRRGTAYNWFASAADRQRPGTDDVSADDPHADGHPPR